jgi:hypothetical protein
MINLPSVFIWDTSTTQSLASTILSGLISVWINLCLWSSVYPWADYLWQSEQVGEHHWHPAWFADWFHRYDVAGEAIMLQCEAHCQADSFPSARENWRITKLNMRTCVVCSTISYLISVCICLILNLIFFEFSLATGINCSGGMRMFGCGNISRPKFGCHISSTHLVASCSSCLSCAHTSVTLCHVWTYAYYTLELCTGMPAACNVCKRSVISAVDCCTAL